VIEELKIEVVEIPKEKLVMNARQIDFSSMAAMTKANLGKWLGQRKIKKKKRKRGS